MKPWICPRCQAVNAPHVSQCTCRPASAPVAPAVPFMPTAPLMPPVDPFPSWPWFGDGSWTCACVRVGSLQVHHCQYQDVWCGTITGTKITGAKIVSNTVCAGTTPASESPP